AIAVSHRQTLFHGALYTYQAHTELVLGHLADATDTTVTEVVDIVHRAETVADVYESLDYVNDVFTAQYARTGGGIATQTTVELHAAYSGEVVALEREEQVLEQVFRTFFRRRFARAHHAVDLYQCVHAVLRGVDAQGVGNERTAVEIVGVDGLEFADAHLDESGQHFLRDFSVAWVFHLTSRLVDDVVGERVADDELSWNSQLG